MSENRRLVILEDDPGTRLLLRNLAETSGWSVEHGSCADAVAHALPHADAITLDVHLAAENGLELLRGLRASGSQVPVIVLSGDDSPATEVEAREAGASHFMLKPFEITELIDLLDEIRRDATTSHVVIDLTNQAEPVQEKAWFMS